MTTHSPPIWGIHLASSTHKLTFLEALNLQNVHYSLCSQQQLLQPHLTIRENLQLLGAFYGLENLNNRLNTLLAWANIQELADQKHLRDIPYETMLLVNLLGALLPSPQLLVIDDLTNGLSLSAQKNLWQWLQQLPEPQPLQIIYLSDKPASFQQFTFAEIWSEQPHQLWVRAFQPVHSPSKSSYLFTFDQDHYAQNFLQNLVKEGFVGEKNGLAEVIVYAFSADVPHLTFTAGLHCTKVQHLEDIFHLQLTTSEGISLDELLSLWHIAPRPVLTTTQQLTAAWKLAWQEWQRHFRGHWQAGNLLFLNLFTLMFMAGFLDIYEQIPAHRRWWIIPLIWLSSAGGCLLWGIEALNRFPTKGDFKTPPTAQRPFSKLSLIDSLGLNRFITLLGLWGGQVLILLSHVLPLVALIAFPTPALFNFAELNSDHLEFLAGVILLWWLIFFYLLPFTILLGRFVQQKATAFLLGFISYWGTVFIVGFVSHLPQQWQTLTWPFTGFFFAYHHYFFELPQPVALPFLVALSTMLLWWCWAIYLFYHQPSAWHR